MYSEKMKAKYMKEDVWKSITLQIGMSQLHNRLTSSQTEILSKWTPSNGYFSILYKMLEKHLWNSFLLYLVVEILQLVHKIAVCLRCSIKEVFWKTSQNSQINTRSRGALSKEKMFLKILQKSQKNGVSFYIKLQAGNLKPSEAVTGDVL